MRLVKGLLDRSLELLGMLAREARWHRLSDIADGLQQQKGPTHRLLAELLQLGWVEQDEATGRYRLTLKLSLMGQQFLHSTGLPGLVQPILDEVAAASGELVRLTVVQDGALHWFASSQGAAPGLMYQPAMSGQLCLHATANGKAWLATLGDEAAVRLARQGGLGRPGAGGAKAVGTAQALLRELALTRRRGYGLAVEEAEPGVKAIAVAIRSIDGERIVGTMSIAGPLLRMGRERDPVFYQLLQEAAAKLRISWPRAESIQISPTPLETEVRTSAKGAR